MPFDRKYGVIFKWMTIVLLILLYTSCILYVFFKKNAYSSTRARSPYTTMICLFLICLDGISNTFIFSVNLEDTKDKEEYHSKRRFVCWAGVWVTMMIFIPILYTMFIKVYRVRKVFELYE